MHVSLTDKLDEYVKNKVATGLYNNASEVIREALRLQMNVEENRSLKLQALRHAIDPAIEQVENDKLLPLDMAEIIAELDDELAQNA